MMSDRKEKLRRAYFALLAEIGVTDDTERHAWQRMLVGKESCRNWTEADFAGAVAALQRFRGNTATSPPAEADELAAGLRWNLLGVREIPLHGQRAVLRITTKVYKGRDRLDLRLFYTAGAQRYPTKKGCTISREDLPALVGALLALQQNLEAATLTAGRRGR